MVVIPKNVLDIIASKEAIKVLGTVSSDGIPHAIVCGSFFATPDGKVGVGEILMKRAAENLKKTKKATLLVEKDHASFELILKDATRLTGKELTDFNGKLPPKLQARALWMFDVSEIWDESAGPTAGSKIA
ncbi:MAG: hypothetical protein MJY64_00600 [archaeon]|nr:hypothetical protein [archaeon]